MIIVMQVGATEAQVEAVASYIRDRGFEPLVLPGEGRTAIGIPSSLNNDQRTDIAAQISAMEGVSRVTQTSHPYKLASREYQRENTVIKVKDVEIGGNAFVVMGGPCSIESQAQFEAAAAVVKESGATILRGGAFKPRTSPYSFQGLAEEGLRIMKEVGDRFGLVTITEVMSGDMVPLVAKYADILQIGARSMQNFPLLVEAGKSGKPVFLKRGPAAGVDDFLLAAEYIMNQGNPNVILCERGIMAFDSTYTRNVLDLGIVPALKEYSHLPVIADPSHGTGVARYVRPMAKAAMVSGADGVMIEMHPNPKEALSDGSQALTPETFISVMEDLKKLAPYVGKSM